MKIDADVRQVLTGSWKNRSGITGRLRESAKESFAANATGRPGRNEQAAYAGLHGTEAKITEALSIAQMAQNVIQKAMVITSQLKNMAMEAMANRGIDGAELARLNADMQSTLGAFADRFSIKVTPPVIASRGGAADITALNLREERELLRGVIVELEQANYGNVAGLDKAYEGFAEKSALLDAMVADLLDRAGKAAEAYPVVHARVDAPALVAATGKLIENDFQTALNGQGNISRKNMTILTRE